MLTNDLSKLKKMPQYSAMCNEKGGVIDDLLVYKLGDDEYILVVNAANTEKDVEWLQTTYERRCRRYNDVSDDYSLLAIQGPRSEKIFTKAIKYELNEIKFIDLNKM